MTKQFEYQSFNAENSLVWGFIERLCKPAAEAARVKIPLKNLLEGATDADALRPAFAAFADKKDGRGRPAFDVIKGFYKVWGDAFNAYADATRCLGNATTEAATDAAFKRQKGALAKLEKLKKAPFGRLAFMNSVCFDAAPAAFDDRRVAFLDVDIDEGVTTAAERADAYAAFNEDPFIVAFWPSTRGEGLHGLFATRAGAAHIAEAIAYIKKVWPRADDKALKLKHIFAVLPARLNPAPAIFEADAEALASYKAMKASEKEKRRAPAFSFSPATPSDAQRTAYFDAYLNGLRRDCRGGLSHDSMLEVALLAGGKLRECRCEYRLEEVVEIIAAACCGEGHKSPERPADIRNQLLCGIEKSNLKVEWKEAAPAAPSTPKKANAPAAIAPTEATNPAAPNPAPAAPSPAELRARLYKAQTVKRGELNAAEAAFIEAFYNVFLPFDGGLCERATGYIYAGFDYKKILQTPAFYIEDEASEGKKRAPSPRVQTIEQTLLKDRNDRRRVELQCVRNYKSAEAVQVKRSNLQNGERAPQVFVNYLPAIAPHDCAYTEKEKTDLSKALRQFAACFDTPKEFVWALNVVCHKAAYNDLSRRSKCILFLFDDGIEGAGAGRGKTLFATLPRFLYGREHVSTTRKKYGFRAEKDFDGDENLMLFNVCNEFRPANQKGYMDELCAFVDESKFDYTEKGKKTISVDTCCQLILTANTAAEMELTNRTKRRFAFCQFGHDWEEGEGAAIVYRMCGNHGDQWTDDDDAEAAALCSCFWAFCRESMREGGALYAPVLADVDKALGHTAGQDLAKSQKAAENSLYQMILDYLAEADERNAEALRAGDAFNAPALVKTDARAIADRLRTSSQAVSKTIEKNNDGAIVATKNGRQTTYTLAAPSTPSTEAEAEAAAPARVWDYPTTFDAVFEAIAETLQAI